MVRMANLLTTDELLNELKKRGDVSFTPKKNKEFYIVDDCWNLIKEFAGMCDYGINWKKLEKVGVDKAHDFYRKNCKRRISNYKINPKETKQMIYKSIFTNYRTQNIMKALAVLSNPVKVSPQITGVNVGDEVIYDDNNHGAWCSQSRLGVVTKVNKTCISWKEYELSGETLSDNTSGFHSQSFETVIHYYDKTQFKKVKAIKSFSKPRDNQLLGFEVRHDWGR